MFALSENPGSLYRQNAAEQIRRAENCLQPDLLFTRDRIRDEFTRERCLREQRKGTRSLIWC
jgi:hypothetical protein